MVQEPKRRPATEESSNLWSRKRQERIILWEMPLRKAKDRVMFIGESCYVNGFEP
jgi:hypothetical protein